MITDLGGIMFTLRFFLNTKSPLWIGYPISKANGEGSFPYNLANTPASYCATHDK